MGMPASTRRAQAARAAAGQFAGMIGMQRDPGGRALDPEGRDHLAADARGIGHRHAGVKADDLDVIDRGEIGHDLGEPPRRQHQGIAAGQDHFPDFRVRADIVERVAIGGVRQRGRLARPDHFAAETEAAIHRADVNQLEQHPVGIAVHDAGNRRMRVIADRIGALARLAHQFLRARNELPRDRIVGIIGIDQRGDIGRHRDGVARGDLFQIGERGRGRKAAGDQFGRLRAMSRPVCDLSCLFMLHLQAASIPPDRF